MDVKNQAAVHLWYPKVFGNEVDPFASSAEAIADGARLVARDPLSSRPSGSRDGERSSHLDLPMFGFGRQLLQCLELEAQQLDEPTVGDRLLEHLKRFPVAPKLDFGRSRVQSARQQRA